MSVFLKNILKSHVNKLAEVAGIKINGNAPFDLIVHDDKFYAELFFKGSLGLGESYMNKNWDAQELDELFFKVLRTNVDEKTKSLWLSFFCGMSNLFFNNQNTLKAFEVGEKHYDKGNKLFEKMLGRTMAYSCAYWKNSNNLDDAQDAKFDLICRKINLKKGERILDIGSGWGGFLFYAAKNYGVEAVGLTVSKEQAKYVDLKKGSLPIEIKLEDYRQLKGERFDKIVSVGMFEHVGPKNYHTFMKLVSENLKEDGLFLLHTIGTNKPMKFADPWVDKYIFPNGILPSPEEILKSSQGFFVLEDWHNFGADYDKTLMAWHDNFEKAWSELKNDYSEEFYRMWKYYLLSFAGNFRARRMQLWQVVFSKKGIIGGYKSVR